MHSLVNSNDKNIFAAIINKEIGIGFKIGYNKKELPYFMQKQYTQKGDTR